MINNSFLVKAIESKVEESSSSDTLLIPQPRRHVVSEPCLPERLPSTGTRLRRVHLYSDRSKLFCSEKQMNMPRGLS